MLRQYFQRGKSAVVPYIDISPLIGTSKIKEPPTIPASRQPHERTFERQKTFVAAPRSRDWTTAGKNNVVKFTQSSNSKDYRYHSDKNEYRKGQWKTDEPSATIGQTRKGRFVEKPADFRKTFENRKEYRRSSVPPKPYKPPEEQKMPPYKPMDRKSFNNPKENKKYKNMAEKSYAIQDGQIISQSPSEVDSTETAAFKKKEFKKRLSSKELFKKDPSEISFFAPKAESDPMFEDGLSLEEESAAGRQIVTDPESGEVIVKASFKDIGLSAGIVERLSQMGIVHPTDIQLQAIGHMLSPKRADILIRSQTGTGKSFGILLGLLGANRRAFDGSRSALVRKLVLVPSAHLANQMYEWAVNILGWTKDDPRLHSTIQTVLPSESHLFNIINDSLKIVPEIVICTPAAISKALQLKSIDLSHIQTIYLDEADFLVKPLKQYATQKDISARSAHPIMAMTLLKQLIDGCKCERKPQVIISSASINMLTRKDLIEGMIIEKPVFVNVGEAFRLPPNIQNYSYTLKKGNNNDEKDSFDEKKAVIDAIVDIASRESGLGLVFIDSVASKVKLQNLLHAAKSQLSTYLLSHLNTSNIPSEGCLIGSDADARGVDIPNLSWVLIVGLPRSVNDYLHMAGRVGRTGQNKSGKVIVIVRDEAELNGMKPVTSLLKFTQTPY